MPAEALAERFPALRRNITKVAAQRLQELEERYREISTETVARSSPGAAT